MFDIIMMMSYKLPCVIIDDLGQTFGCGSVSRFPKSLT